MLTFIFCFSQMENLPNWEVKLFFLSLIAWWMVYKNTSEADYLTGQRRNLLTRCWLCYYSTPFGSSHKYINHFLTRVFFYCFICFSKRVVVMLEQHMFFTLYFCVLSTIPPWFLSNDWYNSHSHRRWIICSVREYGSASLNVNLYGPLIHPVLWIGE